MGETVSDTVGRRIMEGRRQRGWTARQLAENCANAGAPGITAPVIANIEGGRRDEHGRRRRDVTVDELLVFADVFGVPPESLFTPGNLNGDASPQHARWFIAALLGALKTPEVAAAIGRLTAQLDG